MLRNDVSQPTLGHTEACRARMSQTMAKGSEDQKKRILAATNRADEFFAKQIEDANERWKKRKAEPDGTSSLRPRLPAPAAEAQQTSTSSSSGIVRLPQSDLPAPAAAASVVMRHSEKKKRHRDLEDEGDQDLENEINLQTLAWQ